MNTPEKRLPVSEWVKICRGIKQGLHKLKIEFKVELFGTIKDRPICKEIFEHLGDMSIQDYSGKTTLVQTLFPSYKYLSLENLNLRKSATEDPEGFLAIHMVLTNILSKAL